MPQEQDKEWKLEELAEECGVPARTIRLYIARGLLPAPLRGGRGARYGEVHVAQLKKIRELQKAGLSLNEIRLRLADVAQPILAEPEPYWCFVLDRDVTVHVRADASPWRLRQIHSALRNFQKALNQTETEEFPKDESGD